MDVKPASLIAMLLGIVLVGGSAFAHHGAAAYDRSVTLTLKATVTEFIYRNPHIIISFDAADDQGKVVHWSAEGGSPAGLTRRGWTWKTMKAGDQITVDRQSGKRHGRQEHEGDGPHQGGPGQWPGRRPTDARALGGRRSFEMRSALRRVIVSSGAPDDRRTGWTGSIESAVRPGEPVEQRLFCREARSGWCVGRPGGDDDTADGVRVLSRRSATAAANDGLGAGAIRCGGSVVAKPGARRRSGDSGQGERSSVGLFSRTGYPKS